MSIFHEKAKIKLKGIQNSRIILSELATKDLNGIVLIHCASQGEHEQSKPIIRWIISNTKYSILITFFSPSGYQNADVSKSPRISKAYLPFDTPKEMSTFLAKVNPKIALIIKNEWWWNLLLELKMRKIPTHLISATFRKTHYFIKFNNSFTYKILNSISKIFVVDNLSKNAISKVTSSNVIVAGDTRIDQVNYLKTLNNSENNIKDLNSNDVIVYGSIWQSDINSINKLIHLYPDAIHLIYPHVLNQSNLDSLKEKITFAKIVIHTNDIKSGVNIISSMGELKYTYKLAKIAYIGGGFGEGIHNILEASVYNIPVLFGPSFMKSNEAEYLISQNCAFTFRRSDELTDISIHLDKELNRKEIESKLKAYFSPEFSPTEIICKEIFLKNETNV